MRTPIVRTRAERRARRNDVWLVVGSLIASTLLVLLMRWQEAQMLVP